MKKFMIAFAGVALALGAQAAITYQMTTAFEGSLSDETTGYYTLYARAAKDPLVFSKDFGGTRDGIEKYFENAVKGGTWEAAKAAWQSKAYTTDVRTEAAHDFSDVKFNGNALTFDRASSEEQYNYWAVVFYQKGDTEGFRVIEAVNKKGTENVISEGPTRTGTWGDWKAAPEPTSGMLMLLGLAGLALKRKCA